MSVIDSIKAKIVDLEEDIVEINEQIEEDFNPMDWSGGNFDDCYDLGYGHGKKFGRMAAYKEILKMYEQHQQEEAQQKWEDWSKNKKALDKEIEVLMESTQQVLREKIN